jgi:hypothetical protein
MRHAALPRFVFRLRKYREAAEHALELNVLITARPVRPQDIS